MRTYIAIFITSFMFLAAAQAALANDARSVAIVIGAKQGPFITVAESIVDLLGSRDFKVSTHMYQQDSDIASTLESQQPDAIVVLGSTALREVTARIKDIPIVASMILKRNEIPKQKNVTGVYLEFSKDQQFKWLRKIIPDVKKVGVIYNFNENNERVTRARKIAREHELTLTTREVTKPSQLPDALDSLVNEVEVLWGLSDEIVITPQTAKHILLFSFENRIPFAGLSTPWVKAGALYALDRDYTDVGAQCAEIVQSVLNGKSPANIKPVSPRTLKYSLNLKAAEKLKINIPEAIINGATEKF